MPKTKPVSPEKEVKVIIAVPCADSAAMKARTAASIAHAIIGSNGIVIDMLLRLSCDIVSSRTWLVLESIKRGATHILFVDSDMTFQEDILLRLLSHEKEIVGVRYNKREFPLKGVYVDLDEPSDTQLYRAQHVGTGMLLIDLKVFPKLEGAWFNFGRDSQGSLAMGEDVWFCNTARDAGFDVWIDPVPKVGHCGEYVY